MKVYFYGVLGLGSSPECMLFLKKAHIGEVQCSFWPDIVLNECEESKEVLAIKQQAPFYVVINVLVFYIFF